MLSNEIYKELDVLEKIVYELLEENSFLKQRNCFLENNLREKNEKLIEKENILNKVSDENLKLKTVSAIFGNEEHKTALKLQMNRMVKQIDSCIDDLKNY